MIDQQAEAALIFRPASKKVRVFPLQLTLPFLDIPVTPGALSDLLYTNLLQSRLMIISTGITRRNIRLHQGSVSTLACSDD